jgi:hypothetical protein
MDSLFRIDFIQFVRDHFGELTFADDVPGSVRPKGCPCIEALLSLKK